MNSWHSSSSPSPGPTLSPAPTPAPTPTRPCCLIQPWDLGFTRSPFSAYLSHFLSNFKMKRSGQLSISFRLPSEAYRWTEDGGSPSKKQRKSNLNCPDPDADWLNAFLTSRRTWFSRHALHACISWLQRFITVVELPADIGVFMERRNRRHDFS
jgi:hypothetical protein